jgi:hypothetical protein
MMSSKRAPLLLIAAGFAPTQCELVIYTVHLSAYFGARLVFSGVDLKKIVGTKSALSQAELTQQENV